jgi:DNA-directed RNA polymerase subunit RPC12/RpoP
MTSPPDPSTAPGSSDTVDALRYQCGQCGAELAYAPGTTSLACSYCGLLNEIEAGSEPVAELDYREHLQRLGEGAEIEEIKSIKCDACGAETDAPADLDAYACIFCGKSIITAVASRRLIKPGGVLAFGIRHEDAYRQYRQWISRLWFAPNDLKRFARSGRRLDGVYLPFWTYDAESISDYDGERGEDYWVERSYTAMEGGKRVRKTRRERKTRWYPASGTVANAFDDLLIPASRSLPDRFMDKLGPWDLPNVAPFAPEYLAGFRAERYRVELDAGFEAARTVMEPTIRASVNDDIGGDQQRIHALETRYPSITFKHLLLPVWISAYDFRRRTYLIVVNARTGEVQGERPYSAWKIAFTVLAAVLVIAVVMAVAGVLS